jgi:hypothetical protein
VAGFDLTGKIHFMNVDLLSRSSLEPLAVAFGKLSGLCVGRERTLFGAHFELAASYEKDADTLIQGFVDLVRGPHPSASCGTAPSLGTSTLEFSRRETSLPRVAAAPIGDTTS